jgi:hypothetical protein
MPNIALGAGKGKVQVLPRVNKTQKAAPFIGLWYVGQDREEDSWQIDIAATVDMS